MNIEVTSKNRKTENSMSHSVLAKLVFILIPVILYLGGAYVAIDVKESLVSNENVGIDQVVLGVASFFVRASAIVTFILGIILIYFKSPTENTPKWMVKK